jgi:hypothetical protein
MACASLKTWAFIWWWSWRQGPPSRMKGRQILPFSAQDHVSTWNAEWAKILSHVKLEVDSRKL